MADAPVRLGWMRAGAWVAIDVLAAALLLAWGLAMRQPGAAPDWAEHLVLAAMTLPVAVRRRWPVPAFAIVLCATVVSEYVVPMPPPAALALVTYTVGVAGSRRSAVVAGVAALVAVVATTVTRSGLAVGLVVPDAALVIAAWAIGTAVRAQRSVVAARHAQATREAVLAERLKIARELHDIVAHGMTVIAVQAGVALRVVEARPAEGRRALASIAEVSRSGLVELRQMLSTLRGETCAPPPPELGPTPRLRDLDQLAEQARKAGARVSVRISGHARPLGSGIELCAYRIVQEALTNVVKHAGPVSVAVELDYRSDELAIEISDDGRVQRAAPGGAGHGILGMHERVAVFGGALTAGPADPPEPGYVVRAVLPTEGSAA